MVKEEEKSQIETNEVGEKIIRIESCHEGEPDLVSKVGAFVETLVQPLREGVHGSG